MKKLFLIFIFALISFSFKEPDNKSEQTETMFCSCSEWNCTWDGTPNSNCRRFCYASFLQSWTEYKDCAYCPAPPSMCD